MIRTTAFILLLLTAMPWAASSDSASPGQDPKIQSFLEWETKGNPASVRSTRAVKLENFEIPLRLLTADVAAWAQKDILSSLVFVRDGEKYVRWLINPEDTIHYKRVQEFLAKNGMSARRSHYFTGYQTASRSYVVRDPKTNRYFSLKVSTDNTGGDWTDKKLTISQSKQARLVYDYVVRLQQKRAFKNVVLMDEPIMFGIVDLDQALLVRDLGSLPGGKHYYLPGFSAFHKTIGIQIAKMNGSSDPVKFWDEHANKSVGRALGEFFARTGFIHDAPHSQNWLIELDQNMKPTGRIILRDFGDEVIPFEPFFAQTGQGDLMRELGTSEKSLTVGHSMFNGTPTPDWFDRKMITWGKEIYKASGSSLPYEPGEYIYTGLGLEKWAADYFDAFQKEFFKDTGISSKSLDRIISESRDGRKIFTATYHQDYSANTHSDYIKTWVKTWKAIGRSRVSTGCVLRELETLAP